MTSYKTCLPEALRDIDPQNGIILDVRTDMEHAEKRLRCVHAHVALDRLDPDNVMMRHGLDKDSGVYILCRSGKRAAQAAERFVASGYHNVHVVDGGLVSCESSGIGLQGHAANTDSKTTTRKLQIPLERQVRITAGTIAATGALLSLTFNPIFAVIPFFVGCGLVFAGVTDRCGMALILTKAPWNKHNPTTCCTSTACGTPSQASATITGAKTGQSCQ